MSDIAHTDGIACQHWCRQPGCGEPEEHVQRLRTRSGATFVRSPDRIPTRSPVTSTPWSLNRPVRHWSPRELAPQRIVAAVLLHRLGRLDPAGGRRRRSSGGANCSTSTTRPWQRRVLHDGGRDVKYTGDGVLALLRSVTAALTTARSIRDQLAERGLHIRVGVDVGDVDVRGDDVSGLTVNIAARIMGRQRKTRRSFRNGRKREPRLRSLVDEVGVAELKGIPAPFTLHSMAALAARRRGVPGSSRRMRS